MTDGLSLRVEGIDVLRKRLDRAARKDLDREMKKATQQAVLLVEAEAKRNVPQVTRALFRSIGAEVKGRGAKVHGIVHAGGSGAAYARVVEFGSKPHIIRPKRKRALRWRIAPGRGKGAFAFARWVQHPGTTGQPYMEPALESKRRAIVGRFQRALNRVLKKVARPPL